MNGLNINSFYLIALFYLVSEMDIMVSAARYVGYPEIQNGFGMVSSLSRRRPNRHMRNNNENDIQGGFYPFAKRSVDVSQIETTKYNKPNSILISDTDLRCATLEACRGGSDASKIYTNPDEIFNGNTMESIDYLLMPAFRHGFYAKSRAYCQQIYSDCEEKNNL